MRRITIWLLSTLSALVLLFSYHTSTSSSVAASTSIVGPLQAGTGRAATGSGSASGATGSGSAGAGSTGAGSSDSGSTTASGKTYTGNAVQTRWGTVQVQITVSNGKIVASQVLQVPWNNGRDQAINSYAVPVYNRDAVDKQSAKLDVISGATVTWQGYTASLQSAIDAANL